MRAVDLNRLVSYSLRVGVFASSLLSTLGLLVWAARGFNNVVAVSGLAILQVIASAVGGNDSGIIYLAIVILVATPVLRVAISSIYFVKEGDGRYVLISLAVLSMLVFALASGYAG